MNSQNFSFQDVAPPPSSSYILLQVTINKLTRLKRDDLCTHRMSHNALCFVLEIGCEEGGHDAGSRASQNDIVRCILIQVTKHLLLQIHILRNTFLHLIKVTYKCFCILLSFPIPTACIKTWALHRRLLEGVVN